MLQLAKTEDGKACSPPDTTKKFDFYLKNMMMKEYLVLPKSTASSAFYQQNHVNKTLTLPVHYPDRRCKQVGKACGFYPCRAGKCFPEAAPRCCPPMVHRTKQAERPRSHTDVEIPTHKFLHETFTLKIDKRFLRKD